MQTTSIAHTRATDTGASTKEWLQRRPGVAALPPILFGASLGLPFLVMALAGKIVWGGATQLRGAAINGEMLIGIAAVLLTTTALVVGAIAMRVRGQEWRLPLATWGPAVITALICVLAVASDDRPYLFHPIGDTVLGFLLLVALAAAVIYAAWGHALRGALASVSAIMIIGLLMLFAASAGPFNRFDVALSTIPAGLLGGLSIYAYAKARGLARVGWLLVGAAESFAAVLTPGLLIVRPWRLQAGQDMFYWVLPAAMLALLAFGPLVGLLTRRFGRSGT